MSESKIEESRLRILIVMHGAGMGGVEQSIITLCRSLDRERFEPLVLFPSEGYMKDVLVTMGITTLISPMEWITPPAYLSPKGKENHYYNKFLFSIDKRIKNIVAIIREYNIDIVHSSTLTIAEGAIAARIAGIPHIWHIHGKSKPDHIFLPITALYSFVEDFSIKIIAVSNAVKEFISEYISEKDKIDVIYNGIDIEKFNPRGIHESVLYRDYPSLKGKKIVSLIGSVYKVKGIDVYVDTAIEVLKKRDDVAFLVIGKIQDQDLYNRMKNLIDLNNLSDRIVFTGYREDIPLLLRDINLVVCASYSEGFPYVVLESMAASKPVISTRCGGPEEVVLDGETGYLIDKGNPDAMAKAIISIIDDEEKMLTMGWKAREQAGRFNALKYARNFENIYAGAAKNYYHTSTQNAELILNLLSNLGNMGRRVSDLEHEIKEMKGFISHLKDNLLYRILKKVLKKETKFLKQVTGTNEFIDKGLIERDE